MGSSSSSERLAALEGLRGIACLMVVFFHMPTWHSFLQMGLIRNSDLMVDFFFVLSGFIISRTYHNRIKTWGDFIKFQTLRFGRLYPVHFVMLVAFLILECIRYYLWTAGGAPGAAVPFGVNNLQAFVQHLFLLQSVLPLGDVMSFNVPAWSISTEFYTYIIFALLLLIFRSLSAGLIFCVGSVALAAFVGTTGELKNFSACVLGFFLGVGVDLVSRKYQIKVPSIFFFATVALLLLNLANSDGGWMHLMVFPLSAAIVFAVANARDDAPRKVFGSPLMVQLGAYSYTIYMTHSFVIWIVESFFKRVVIKDGGATLDGFEGGMLAVLAITCVLVGTFMMSIGIKRWVEDPARAWFRAYANNRT